MLSPVKIWRNQKKIQKLLQQEGEIITFSKVFVPPCGFSAQAPYVVAVVRLKNGINYTAQLVDFEENQVKTGYKVRTVLRRTSESEGEGVIPYGIKFRPI
jgi:uncharacterized OB-fold protein